MEHGKTTSDIYSNTGRRGVSQTSALVAFTACILAVLLVQSPDAAGQSISDNHSGDVEITRQCDGWVNFNGSRVLIHEAPPDAVVSSIDTLNHHLEPREYNQINHILGRLSGTRIDDAYAVVTTPTADGAFVAYASVVDNVTQDSIFIPAQVVKGGYQ